MRHTFNLKYCHVTLRGNIFQRSVDISVVYVTLIVEKLHIFLFNENHKNIIKTILGSVKFNKPFYWNRMSHDIETSLLIIMPKPMH